MSLAESRVVRPSRLDQVRHEGHHHQDDPRAPRGPDRPGCPSRWWCPHHSHPVARCLDPRVAVLEPCVVHQACCTQGRLWPEDQHEARGAPALQQHPGATRRCDSCAQPEQDGMSASRVGRRERERKLEVRRGKELIINAVAERCGGSGRRITTERIPPTRTPSQRRVRHPPLVRRHQRTGQPGD